MNFQELMKELRSAQRAWRERLDAMTPGERRAALDDYERMIADHNASLPPPEDDGN